jgi:hypothetical protein
MGQPAPKIRPITESQMTGPPSPSIAASVAAPQPLAAGRFTTPINDCQVDNKSNLNTYRQLWRKWMSWYEHTPGEPHSIESQIHQMIFNDLTYRASVSVRESVAGGSAISAHSPTLAYLIDRGYVLSQVLAIQKLLDKGSGVISVRRLLQDVEKHRDVITREVYVSGDGHPYDCDSWPEIYGFGDVRLFFSKLRHETFDVLSDKEASQRSREDTIRPSVFKTLNGWIDVPSADEIELIRNNFIAHSADAFKRGAYQFAGVKFSQIDELQRAIIRVERALTDYILAIGIGRNVVPVKPLGIFSGLDLPYAPLGAQDSMHKRWDELADERNTWNLGVLEDLTRSRSK